MSLRLPAALTRGLTAAALCTAFAAHAAPEDWQAVAASCQPTNTTSFSQAVFNFQNNGAIRANAGDGQLKYVCNVLDSFASSLTVNWNTFRLQYADPVGGAVQAQLFSKNKTTGAVALVATVGSPAGAGIQTNAVALPVALNFDLNGYFVVITLTRQPAATPAAHMVSLNLI
jgi:hypothetical protein